jgi:hypothetical protein
MLYKIIQLEEEKVVSVSQPDIVFNREQLLLRKANIEKSIQINTEKLAEINKQLEDIK